MSTPFPFDWVLQAIRAIDDSTTLHQALKVTASNLSDLLDTLIPIAEPGGMLEGQYQEFCDLKIKECGGENTGNHLYFLQTARDIFHLYEKSSEMAQWELQHEASKLLAPEFDAEEDKEDSIRILFAHACSYYQSWTEAEINNPRPRVLRQLTFETWEFYGMTPLPDDFHLYPEEEPAPDGMDEFLRVGLD